MYSIFALFIVSMSLYAQEKAPTERERKNTSSLPLSLLRYQPLTVEPLRESPYAIVPQPYNQVATHRLSASLGSVDFISDTGVIYGMDTRRQNLIGFDLRRKRTVKLQRPLSAAQAWRALYGTDKPNALFAPNPVAHVVSTYPTIFFSLTKKSSILGSYNVETGAVTKFLIPFEFGITKEWHTAIQQASSDGQRLLLQTTASYPLLLQDKSEEEKNLVRICQQKQPPSFLTTHGMIPILSAVYPIMTAQLLPFPSAPNRLQK